MSTSMPPAHHLIGLTGRAGTGKDSAADHLVREYGFTRTSFAEPLKDMLEQMLTAASLDYAWLYEPTLKNRPIPELGVSARTLMQTLGTDWGRMCVSRDLWRKLLARRLGLHDLPASAPVHDRIVITDVRFPNEADWINATGGHIARLRREQAGPVREHESEWHIDTLPVRVDLVNNGPTLTGLHTLVDGFMADLGISRREGNEQWVGP